MLDIQKALSKVFIFSQIAPGELMTLASCSSVVRVNRHQNLFHEGDEAESLYVVLHGKIHVFRFAHDGSEVNLHVMTAGDLVAEAAIFLGGRYPANSSALEDSLLVKIPSAAFKELITRNPHNALKIMSSYSAKLHDFVQMVEYLTINSVKQRLILYLIKNAISVKNSQEYRCELSITKRKLASLLGTVPETLSRNLSKLREEEIIKIAGKSIIITNIQSLRELAN